MADDRLLELKGVEYHSQGTHDGLCVYYSACTLFATLLPETRQLLGDGERVRNAGFKTKDPLLLAAAKKEVNAKASAQVAVALANWYFRGAYLPVVVGYMNEAAKEFCDAKKPFTLIGKGKHTQTKLLAARESLEAGLPIMLAWDSRAYGNHCVAVSGYRVGTSGGVENTWFTLEDPGGDYRISWSELELFGTNIELIVPNPDAFPGLRPDKQTWKEKPDGKIVSRGEYRWWPVMEDGRCEYVDLGKLFEEARKNPVRRLAGN